MKTLSIISFLLCSSCSVQLANAGSYSGGLPLAVTNASVGLNGITAPASSTLGGYRDSSGNLQPFTGTPGGGISVTANRNWYLNSNTDSVTVTGTVTANIAGKSPVDLLRLNYAVTNVATSSFVQVSSGILGTCTEVDIFDSSGQTLFLGVNDIPKIYVVPGGNGRLPISITAGSAVSLKAVSSTATAGEFDLNCYN